MTENSFNLLFVVVTVLLLDSTKYRINPLVLNIPPQNNIIDTCATNNLLISDVVE